MKAQAYPEHGTTAYKRGCRCDACHHATAKAAASRSRALAYGHVYTTDPAPVRAHIELLRDNGLTYSQIARLAGVSRSCVIAAVGIEGRAPTKRMRVDNARRILAARPKITELRPADLISAVGTVRRLQALAALGWHARLLAEESGLPSKTIEHVRHRQQPKVRRATADAVKAVYGRLSLTVPPASERTSQMRTLARRAGWLPPGVWDDDAIDVPDATPQTGDEGLKLVRPLVIAEDVEFIERTTGVTDREVIAARLLIHRDVLDQNLRRPRRMGLVREQVAA